MSRRMVPVGTRAVRRLVSDYARVPSPHGDALAEIAGVLSAPSRNDRRSRARGRRH